MQVKELVQAMDTDFRDLCAHQNSIDAIKDCVGETKKALNTLRSTVESLKRWPTNGTSIGEDKNYQSVHVEASENLPDLEKHKRSPVSKITFPHFITLTMNLQNFLRILTRIKPLVNVN